MDDELNDWVDFRLEFKICPALAGSKTAVQYGDGAVLISPAMGDLLKNAAPDELEGLLKAIPLLKLPESAQLPSPYSYTPMFSQTFDWDKK